MKKLFVLTISITFLLGCSKNEVIKDVQLPVQKLESVPDVLSILELLNQPVNGFIYFRSYATLATQAYPVPVFGAHIADLNGSFRDFGQLDISGILLSPDAGNNNIYDVVGPPNALGLYGNSAAIELAGTNELPGIDLYSFDLNDQLLVSNPLFQNNSMTIYEGMEIEWNADIDNTFGIGILIEYDPYSYENDGVGGSPVRQEMLIEDDGSYIIAAEDISSIPQGGRVYLTIGRGNYERVPMNGNSGYYVGAYSYSVVDLSLKKE